MSEADQSQRHSDDGFFVGYINALPGALSWFVPAIAFALIILFAAAGLLVAAGQANPGDGRFLWALGNQKFTGVLEARPYPIVHVAATEHFPLGRTLMLSGQGKRGVQDRAAKLDGQVVRVEGILLKRGDLDMLQVSKLGPLEADAGDAGVDRGKAAPVPLGRWRLTGEICDGKCEAGAMRPGRGLSHKACANLCLIGGVPPVFVSTKKVQGHDFFLIGDAQGNPLTGRILDYVARPVQAEGNIEKRGDLLIFKLDTRTLRALSSAGR